MLQLPVPGETELLCKASPLWETARAVPPCSSLQGPALAALRPKAQCQPLCSCHFCLQPSKECPIGVCPFATFTAMPGADLEWGKVGDPFHKTRSAAIEVHLPLPGGFVGHRRHH